MDCGYAAIKGKYNNKLFVFTKYYSVLDKNIDEKNTIKSFT